MDKWEKKLDEDIKKISKSNKINVFLIISIVLVLIAMLIIITMPIWSIWVLSGKTSYNTVNLKNINEQEKQEIIQLLELQEISDYIELEKIKIPLVHKDIYYRIYFYITDNNIELNNNSLYKVGNNRYYDIVSDKGKTIDILENIFDKYNT